MPETIINDITDFSKRSIKDINARPSIESRDRFPDPVDIPHFHLPADSKCFRRTENQTARVPNTNPRIPCSDCRETFSKTFLRLGLVFRHEAAGIFISSDVYNRFCHLKDVKVHTLVVINNSSLLTLFLASHALIAFPIMDSFPYVKAVSMWRYPASNAAVTAFSVSSGFAFKNESQSVKGFCVKLSEP